MRLMNYLRNAIGWRSEQANGVAMPEGQTATSLVKDIQQRSLAIPVGYCSEFDSDMMVLTEEMLSRHALVLGATGSGKTVFCVNLFLSLVVHGLRGGVFIDPKADAIDDILAFIHKRVSATGCEALLKRIHILELQVDSVFGFDFFRYVDEEKIPSRQREPRYELWLAKKVDAIVETVCRIEAESPDGKVRLRRVLTTVLNAVGTAIDNKRKHLPLSETLCLLDVQHPRHDEVFARVEPHLHGHILSDLNTLRSFRNRLQDYMAQAESSLNRVRNILSPLMRAVTSKTMETIDFSEMIKGDQCLLVNLAETPVVSNQQNRVLGGLIIHELVEAAATMPRKQRRPYYLFVDEAHVHFGDDCERLIRQGRAWKLRGVFSSQNMSGFLRSEELDYREVVLTEPQAKFVFNQQVMNDSLIENLGMPNVDFTKHVVEVDRHDGCEYMQTYSVGRSRSDQEATQLGGSTSESRSYGQTRGTTLSNIDGVSKGLSRNKSQEYGIQTGQGKQVELTFGESEGRSRSRSSGENQNITVGLQQSFSRTTTNEESQSISHDVSQSHTDGTSESNGSSTSITNDTTINDGSSQSFQFTDDGMKRTAVENSGRTNRFGESSTGTSNTTESSSVTESESVRKTRSRSHSVSNGKTDSISVGMGIGRNDSTSKTSNKSKQWGQSNAESESDSESLKVGDGESTMMQQSHQQGGSFSAGTSRTLGQTRGVNWSTKRGTSVGENVSIGWTPVAKIRRESQEQACLATAVTDQLYMLRKELMTLGNAQCFVRLYGIKRTMRLDVFKVQPPYTADEFFDVVDEMREMIKQQHSYNFVPDLSIDAEDRRIDAYLGLDEPDNEQPPESTGGAFEM